jgi:hypothetical protein
MLVEWKKVRMCKSNEAKLTNPDVTQVYQKGKSEEVLPLLPIK